MLIQRRGDANLLRRRSANDLIQGLLKQVIKGLKQLGGRGDEVAVRQGLGGVGVPSDDAGDAELDVGVKDDQFLRVEDPGASGVCLWCDGGFCTVEGEENR